MENSVLSELFRHYSDDVFRLAYSYLGNRAEAEDVCQAVFLKLVERHARLEEGKEKAWLLTCTANACKNHLRSFWRRNTEELNETIPFQDGRNRDVHQAVMTLPPKYRAVIHLYYFEGYGQGEIGELLHISRTAVQKRMSRARTMLRKELRDDEIEL